MPSVSSERREYIPCDFLFLDTVISNSAQVTQTTPGRAYFLPEGDQNTIFKEISKYCPSGPLTLPAFTEASIFYHDYGIPTILIGTYDIFVPIDIIR